MKNTPDETAQTISFERLKVFEKEFTRLLKKYRSLTKDLQLFQDVLTVFPTGQSNNTEIFHDARNIKIVKSRLFCRDLRGATLRIVYAYHIVERKICFIEIYFKGDKQNEDRGRIAQYADEYSK